MNELTELRRQMLEKDIPVIRADIKAIYEKLDKRFDLQGAQIPITFGYEEDLLGAYVQQSTEKREHFHFSLLFVGYAVSHPLDRADREDLYLHEYAHYMQYNMEIPVKYKWQSGIHGSAWKYCCSLVGAAPTPYYKAGEALIKHDYDKVLSKKNIASKTIPLLDNYQREQQYRVVKNTAVKFKEGDTVMHPSFGEGTVTEIIPRETSVLLRIKFGDTEKKIDQAWLLKAMRKKAT